MLFLLSALLDWRLLRPPPPRRVAWLHGAIFAHRGMHTGSVPENSSAAFAAAVARGIGIECDVQRSADDQAMVFHDAELDRLTALSGPLINRSAAQLARATLLGSAEGIPTLRELLAQVAGRVPLLIEVKAPPGLHVAPLCLAVRRVLEGYQGPVAVMSFDPKVPRWFHRHSPHILHGLVVSEAGRRTLFGTWRRRRSFWRGRPQFFAWDVRDLPSRLAARHRARGLPVLTWTVRDAAQLERAVACADAPIAEGPGLAEALRGAPPRP